jgi:hypothetical protein
MSATIVPPQPVMKECGERPRTRTLALAALMFVLLQTGKIVSDWIEAGPPWTELPRFIHWNTLFTALCLLGLTLFSRYTEKPRLVIRKIPRPTLGIH